MSSSGPDNSLPISLPQWMKSRINDRYDLDQSAFSPPSNDDDFLVLRYKKSSSVESEKVPDSSLSSPLTKIVASKLTVANKFIVDPSSHTEPCQQFIPRAKITPREIGMRHGVDPPLGRVASTGVDDGFTGEGAACGYSVVAVAHQMLSGKTEQKGDKLATPKFPGQRVRRNSRSLPVSPQTSPKLLRKNPFFTEILFGSSDQVDSQNNNTLTSAEYAEKWTKMGRTFGESDTPPNYEPIKTLKAKPSELREMNFWSPTSM